MFNLKSKGQTMKKTITFIAALALIAFLPVNSNAQLLSYSAGGTALSSNISWAVISAKGIGTPLVTFVSAQSDTTNGYVRTWIPTTNLCYAISNNVTTSVAVQTNLSINITNNDVVVVYSPGTDTYTRAVVSDATGTNITFTTTVTVYAGDLIYEMKTNGLISLATSTTDYATAASKGVNITSAGGVASGLAGKPFLVETYNSGATTNNKLYNVNAIYLK
jgi:hypothetical protein